MPDRILSRDSQIRLLFGAQYGDLSLVVCHIPASQPM